MSGVFYKDSVRRFRADIQYRANLVDWSFLTFIAFILFFTSLHVSQAHSRDQIRIVGSSTVFPFSAAVAERFGRSNFKTPLVESTGTGGGFKIFCQGIGTDKPDISNASRRIKKSELQKCNKNGVSVIEVKFGYDGIVLAWQKNNKDISLTRRQIFQALAGEVIIDGKRHKNPYKKWSDIDASLPDIEIKVMGPPPTSGTRDAFVELVMQKGGATFPQIAALQKTDEKAFKAITHFIREDGAYIEASENDNIVVQKLSVNKKLIGIFGYSFLEENLDIIKALSVEKVQPQFETIVDGSYNLSRSLYFYIKREHVNVIKGLKQFTEYFMSENTAGEDGYLADKALIPLTSKERQQVHRAISKLSTLSF